MTQVIPNPSFLDVLRNLECYETFRHAELLTEDFIQKHTAFATKDGFFFGLPKPEKCTFALLDKYVKRHTRFDGWIEMLCAANEV